MKNFKFLIFCTLLSVLFSCTNGIEEDIVEEEELSCFCIEALVDGELVQYTTLNTASPHQSNRYIISSQHTWLTAYSEEPTIGYWRIIIYDQNIEEIALPYKLKPGEGVAFWFDETFDEIEPNYPICDSFLAGCKFNLSSYYTGNEIAITSVEDGVIQGKFSGKAFIAGTGNSLWADTSAYHTVTGGRFKLKYDKI